MENKTHDVEIELLLSEYEMLQMALNAVGDVKDDCIARALLMGGAAVRLLEQGDEQEVISLVEDAQNILEQAARLERSFTRDIQKGMFQRATDHIMKAIGLLEDTDSMQEAAEATGATEDATYDTEDATYDTEDATYDTEEVNPYKELCENLMDAAELLRASGALLPEFVAMKEAGLQKARLMVAIALAELCE